MVFGVLFLVEVVDGGFRVFFSDLATFLVSPLESRMIWAFLKFFFIFEFFRIFSNFFKSFSFFKFFRFFSSLLVFFKSFRFIFIFFLFLEVFLGRSLFFDFST